MFYVYKQTSSTARYFNQLIKNILTIRRILLCRPRRQLRRRQNLSNLHHFPLLRRPCNKPEDESPKTRPTNPGPTFFPETTESLPIVYPFG